MPTEILILGAVGYVKIVIKAFILSNQTIKIVLSDQFPDKLESLLPRSSLVELRNTSSKLTMHFHIVIGSNCSRDKLCNLSQAMNSSITSIVHPGAFMSPTAEIRAGCFIAAGSELSSDAVLEEGCIINHGSVIDHDCRIGRFTHVAPNATVCGGVHIGESCLIDAGATILPMASIGRNAVIGAGAVIKGDIPAYKTVVGVPGKQI